MLVLFLAYLTSSIAFAHVHNVNGVLIAHSHPFQGNHTHSESEFIVIGRLSSFLSPEIDTCGELHPMRRLLAVLEAGKPASPVKGKRGQAISLRAPPALAA